jgi:hypothetical protein
MTMQSNKSDGLWLSPSDRADARRAFARSSVPRAVPEGHVLAHNHIRHRERTRHGTNGFRCWMWPKADVPREFTPCTCGWSGLPHVAERPGLRPS